MNYFEKQEMPKTEALGRELIVAERELLESLMIALPLCAEHGALIFFNSKNIPDEYQLGWLPAESDELFQLATRCITLRRQLGLPAAQTAPQLFLDACEEHCNRSNPHRRGPRKLATWLLAELQSRFCG